jgi:glycosyltransferase involved in cell wall biosynthesis
VPLEGGGVRRLLHFFWFNYHRRLGDENLYQDSNSEIQKWAEKRLAGRFAVHSTSCVTQGRVTVSKEDILLGHPNWDTHAAATGRFGRSDRDWMRDNRLLDADACHPNSYVLMPWVPQFPGDWTRHMPCYESQLERARLIFAICGRIWLERTLALRDASIQSRVKEKLVRLNMCVNSSAFTIGKEAFNPVGARRLIHVSNMAPYKNVDLLLQSAHGVTVPSIGSRALKKMAPGPAEMEVAGIGLPFNNLGAVNNDDGAQIRALVRDHDFYIHSSSMDAQATTILEFAARGLIPIVTPESGFESGDAVYLTDSPAKNREIIRQALAMSDEECMHRSRRLREQIRRDHSWEAFYDAIGAKILATCEN